MVRHYCSPLTGDIWPDPRPAVGTLAGLANFLNEKRPRRKPPEGHDTAIALATEAAAGLAGVPRIDRFGPNGITFAEGAAISDAYWKAKEAKQKLTLLVEDGVFLQRQQWFGESWARFRAGGADSWEARDIERHQLNVTMSTRAARIAWYATNLAEKFAAGSEPEMDNRSYAHDAILGALAELDEARVSREAAAGVERVWRFVVAAGRMPVPGVDDDLLAAFEAALMAGELDFGAAPRTRGLGARIEREWVVDVKR